MRTKQIAAFALATLMGVSMMGAVPAQASTKILMYKGESRKLTMPKKIKAVKVSNKKVSAKKTSKKKFRIKAKKIGTSTVRVRLKGGKIRKYKITIRKKNGIDPRVDVAHFNDETIMNILYGIETGGLQYGNANYGAVEMPHANTSSESEIAIGAGAWYGDEAKELLTYLKQKNYCDTSDILANWNEAKYGNNGWADKISKILSSKKGKEGQYFFALGKIHKLEKVAEALGIDDQSAKAMWIVAYQMSPRRAMNLEIGGDYKDMYKAIMKDSLFGKYKSRFQFAKRSIQTHFHFI